MPWMVSSNCGKCASWLHLVPSFVDRSLFGAYSWSLSICCSSGVCKYLVATAAVAIHADQVLSARSLSFASSPTPVPVRLAYTDTIFPPIFFLESQCTFGLPQYWNFVWRQQDEDTPSRITPVVCHPETLVVLSTRGRLRHPGQVRRATGARSDMIFCGKTRFAGIRGRTSVGER